MTNACNWHMHAVHAHVAAFRGDLLTICSVVTRMHVYACRPCTLYCNSTLRAVFAWLLLLIFPGLGKALQEALEELKFVPPTSLPLLRSLHLPLLFSLFLS